MLVRTDVFQKLGGFDERFGPFGPEDLDFSLRCYRQGYHALYIPQALAFHEVSHSFEGGKYTELYARNKVRHWLVFLRRHGPLAEQLAFLFIGAPYRGVRMILREGKQGNLAALSGVLRGLLDIWNSKRQPER
jgi:GT2 family glycosyltransferase